MGSRQQARKAKAPQRPQAKPRPSKKPPAPRPTPKPKNPFLVFFRALAALIDAHRSRQTDPTAQVLIAGIEALLTRAEEALAAPDKVRLVPHQEGPVVGLRLVDASPPAPSSSPTTPPPSSPALGPAHHALAWSTFEAIDSLSDVREAVSAVEADTEALRLDGAETGHLEATLATLRSDLWTLGGHLATISHNLTGESAADSLASHAAALRLLVLLTSDESQRRHIERRVLDGASGAFAKPAA